MTSQHDWEIFAWSIKWGFNANAGWMLSTMTIQAA
jgi:hypothetical protein